MTVISMNSMDPNDGTFMTARVNDFLEMRSKLINRLLETEPQNQGTWQKLDVSESELHKTYELLNLSLRYDMPLSIESAQEFIQPDLPWAEGHFQERVGGDPVNPGSWHDKWPYHAGQVDLHQNGGKYDHNYMERIWPKELEFQDKNSEPFGYRFAGYRFAVGDLDDVVQLLAKDPGTRQAYLPIWFPEDTGSTSGQRVPCSLGYHFIIRDDLLHCQYTLRSCEAYRHFTNDVYMAVRLAQWVAQRWNEIRGRSSSRGSSEWENSLSVGTLSINIVSFHGFYGDTSRLRNLAKQGELGVSFSVSD